MNNLKLCAEVPLNLELQSKDEILLFSALDIEQNRLFFASSANNIYSAQLSSFQVSLSSLLVPCFVIDEFNSFILCFVWFIKKETVCRCYFGNLKTYFKCFLNKQFVKLYA